jgi:hypothetical protein
VLDSASTTMQDSASSTVLDSASSTVLDSASQPHSQHCLLVCQSSSIDNHELVSPMWLASFFKCTNSSKCELKKS